MTRDEIIRMAREAYGDWYPNAVPYELERFAGLVAAAERETMKLDGWRQCAVGQRTTQYCGQLEAAIAAEREACAKVCEEMTASWTEPVYNGACVECATAIRARGEK